MTDVSDLELLRCYHREGSETAFAELVQRHLSLVYSAAFRHVGIAAHAEEVTQAVFIILAHKAGSLRSGIILESWLYTTTRLTALSFLRGERRRQFREQEAYMRSTLQETTHDSAWDQLAPLLDEGMSRLGKKDRDAVMLRFFKDKSLREVATILYVNETAAQKRVHRAVEKLRQFFLRRGIILPAAALTAAISANSVRAAPATMVKTITAVALAKGAAASTSTLTLIKGALKIMAWTKAKMAVVVCLGVIFAAGTTTIVVTEMSSRPTSYKGKPLNEWLKNLDDQHPGQANDDAEEAVRHIGKNGLPLIISLLPLKNPMHHSAVLACQILGPDATPAIPALMKLLNDGYARGYVGVAMGRIGQEAIVPLTMALTNEDVLVREEVASGLGYMQSYSGKSEIQMSKAISTLVTCLADKSPYVRTLAARSLGEIKENETTVVPVLIESLNDPDFQTRWNACLALGKFGTRAASAVPSLLATLQDKNTSVRATAAIALVEIEPDNAAQIDSLMPVLIENIDGLGVHKDVNFRSTTAVALSLCGEKAKRAIPTLLKAVQNTSGYEQQEILEALGKIDPTAAANKDSQ